MIFHEAVIWKRMHHPNIVPFHGVTLNHLWLVSEWMDSEDLPEFARNCQNINRLSLVRVLSVAEVGFQSPHSFTSYVTLLRV
jgi:serine/threonine protein kinase